MPKKIKHSEKNGLIVKSDLSFDQLMKKALNTPLPKKAKKKAAAKKK